MFAPFPVLMDGDPFLRQRSAEVTEFGPSLDPLLEQMAAVFNARHAFGLAAVQIGTAKRIILVRGEGFMLNPVLTRTLNRLDSAEEGCLSVEKKNWRAVSRPAKCEVSWVDRNGRSHADGFSGLTARIIQHEIDHLDGMLITDK